MVTKVTMSKFPIGLPFRLITFFISFQISFAIKENHLANLGLCTYFLDRFR